MRGLLKSHSHIRFLSLPLYLVICMSLTSVALGCESSSENELSSQSFDFLQPDDVTDSKTNDDKEDAEAPYVPMDLSRLRDLAQKVGLDLGVALDYKHFSKPRYTDIAAQEFNAVTSENQMKWESIHSTKEGFEWFFGDDFVAFTQRNKMQLRGHTLVWHSQLPAWVQQEAQSKQQVLSIVENHVRTIVSHYRGKVQKWDVVNEVISDQSGMRPSVFYDLAGNDFIELAFRVAHDADPGCKLYINDYSVEDVNPKSDRLYELVKNLINKGVPIHGVGFQSHWDLDYLPSIESVKKNIERFTALGLEVDITELDIRIKGKVTKKRLNDQAAAYASVFKLILELPKTNTIVLWGLDDGHSWVPGWQPAYGSPLILDSHYRAKPAYEAIYNVLKMAAE